MRDVFPQCMLQRIPTALIRSQVFFKRATKRFKRWLFCIRKSTRKKLFQKRSGPYRVLDEIGGKRPTVHQPRFQNPAKPCTSPPLFRPLQPTYGPVEPEPIDQAPFPYPSLPRSRKHSQAGTSAQGRHRTHIAASSPFLLTQSRHECQPLCLAISKVFAATAIDMFSSWASSAIVLLSGDSIFFRTASLRSTGYPMVFLSMPPSPIGVPSPEYDNYPERGGFS